MIKYNYEEKSLEMIILSKFKILLVSFIIFMCMSCSNATSEAESYEYFLQDEFSSINISWNYGTINFINSNEIKLEESSENKIKNVEKLSYSIEGETLDIEYKGKKNRNLTFYLDKNKTYSSININGVAINFLMEKMIVTKLNILSKIGQYTISSCKILNFVSNINSTDRYAPSIIMNSQINTCDICYNKIHSLNLIYSYFSSVNLKLNNASVAFNHNNFDQLTIEQNAGNTHLELDGNNGYTFNIACNDITLDFETINYLNKYFYKNGDKKLNLSNPTGSLDIRRYFS